MRRRGFTLIELLISITIIGLLSGLVLLALQRASAASKIIHTKSTIAKLNASLMDRWEGYRARRVPLDPVAILNNIKANNGGTYLTLQGVIANMSARRIAASNGALHQYPTPPYDPLSVPWSAPPVMVNGNPQPIYPNPVLAAAVRLLAMREIMQYEMPSSYSDFIGNFSSSTAAGGYTMRGTYVLPVAPQITATYLRAVNVASINGATFAQIEANQSAECLYMILTLGSTDSGMFGEQLPNDDIGDVDGDGLPEFQDAWAVSTNSYQPKGKANSPIDFMRWAPGFVSDLQPNPNPPAPSNMSEFSFSHHDYFDPLKLDIPAAVSGQPMTPRGYQLTPLIYSAGPDGDWAITLVGGMSDPYDAAGYTAGQWAGTLNTLTSKQGADADNITNHDLDTRAGK